MARTPATALRVRKQVQEFAQDMERRLKPHDTTRGTRGWYGNDLQDLRVRLFEEACELSHALEGSPRSDILIIEECADVANFAMMIADNCRSRLGLKQGE